MTSAPPAIAGKGTVPAGEDKAPSVAVALIGKKTTVLLMSDGRIVEIASSEWPSKGVTR